MTDIHSHVLCRFDDGPASIEESISLLCDCEKKGVTTICSTSHYYSAHMPCEDFVDRRERRIAELNSIMTQRKIGINIVPASEVHMTNYLLNLKTIKELCYANTNYILLEIPHNNIDVETNFSLIDRIISYYNVKPIIAHIERYGFLLKSQGNLDRLHSMGCLFQIDADVLINGSWFQKMPVEKLIKRGYVDFVASDCHGGDRVQNLSEAYEVISRKFGKDYVERFKENTMKLLNNDPVEKICV